MPFAPSAVRTMAASRARRRKTMNTQNGVEVIHMFQAM
jgi:hypothetical protein